MTTYVAVDYRRTDQRTNILENPFWLTSGLVLGTDMSNAGTAKAALLFSFPTAGRIIIVQEVIVQMVAAATSGTTIDIGQGTLATNAVTTGGVITDVDDNMYMLNSDVTVATPAAYGPVTAHTSAWLTDKVAGTWTTNRYILGVATAVPTIYAKVYNVGAIAAGSFRVHMLVTMLPGT